MDDRPFSEATRDLRTSTIELREQLVGLERDWLVGELLESRGVRAVKYPAGAAGDRLTVVYDAAELNDADLVDLLRRFGLRNHPVVL